MIDYGILFSMLITNVGLLYWACSRIRDNYKKIMLIMATIGIFVYSGLGISTGFTDDKFVYDYLVFSNLFIASFFLWDYLGVRVPVGRISSSSLYYMLINNKWFLNISLLMYFLTFLVFVLYPVLRLEDLYLFYKNISLKLVFENRSISRMDTVLYTATVLRVILLPFFMIKLQSLRQQSKRGSFFLISILWVYLTTVCNMYIGRYELIIFALFIYMGSKKHIKLRMSEVFIGALVVILSVPALVYYQFYRLGADIPDMSYSEVFMILAQIEFSFPQYYYHAISLSESYSIINYLLWLFTLIIPSAIFENKANYALSINDLFSTHETGISIGDQGYNILLTGLLGEGFIIYGDSFFWLHAIFLSFALVIFANTIRQIKELDTMYLYMVALSASIARGGTQGYISIMVNAFLGYAVFRYVLGRLKNNY